MVMAACSSSPSAGDGGKPTDASVESAAPSDAGQSCNAAFQTLVFSAPKGVSGGNFIGMPTGDNSGGQPFLNLNEGVGRSFDVEFFDPTLPPEGKVFDYGTQGMPGGPNTAWGSYFEAMNVLTPVSGKVTVICSKGRFLAVTLTNVVLEGGAGDGGAMSSITVNGSIGATIP
jgi:hypothetical protein